MTSRLMKKMEKKAYYIGDTNEDILSKFPNAKKENEYSWIAVQDGMTYYIGWDSAFQNWKIFGRTKSEPNTFKRLMNFLIGIN